MSDQPRNTPPIVMTIAGSDSSGGAGLQADLKTFSAFAVYGASVVTAITAQNTCGVTSVQAVSPEMIAAQFHAVTSDLAVAAIKTGMLGDAAVVQQVADLLATRPGIPVVVDPVMVATSGDVLVPVDAVAAIRHDLLPRAMLITPNLPEAATLLDEPVARNVSERIDQARRLLGFGCQAVLIKGGHGDDSEISNVLVCADGHQVFTHPRIATRNTHGTGCTLSAAITASLALGESLDQAVAIGLDFTAKAIASGASFEIGAGHGPVDHHFQIRNVTEALVKR